MRRKPSPRTPMVLYVLALCFVAPLEAQERGTDDFVPVTDSMLRDPGPADWLMVHRTYDHYAYSPLDQINQGNVGGLRLVWMRAMDNEGPQQLRRLVYDGVMYIAHPGSDHLQALDATTGDLIWDYRRELPTDLRDPDRQLHAQPGDLWLQHPPSVSRRALGGDRRAYPDA